MDSQAFKLRHTDELDLLALDGTSVACREVFQVKDGNDGIFVDVEPALTRQEFINFALVVVARCKLLAANYDGRLGLPCSTDMGLAVLVVHLLFFNDESCVKIFKISPSINLRSADTFTIKKVVYLQRFI